MTWYDKELEVLSKEIDPWLFFDPESFSFRLKPDAPEEIRKKREKELAIANSIPESWR